MSIRHLPLQTLGILLFLNTLFLGCSGHVLQELVDGKTEHNTSSAHLSRHNDRQKTTSPSQNSALNMISPSSTAGDAHKEYREMQNMVNIWIEDEWEPLTENNLSVTESNITIHDNVELTIEDDNSTLTLQYYLDKATRYIENRQRRDAHKSKGPSHIEKINKMPGIGISKSRR